MGVSARSHRAIFSPSGKFRLFWPQKRTQAVACFTTSFSLRVGETMLAIAMLATAVGLALGLRFGAATLALLTLAIMLIFAIAVLGGGGPLVLAFKMLVAVISIQISYLFGSLFAAHFPARPRAASDRAQARYLRGL
jgi:hypothetical protein